VHAVDEEFHGVAVRGERGHITVVPPSTTNSWPLT